MDQNSIMSYQSTQNVLYDMINHANFFHEQKGMESKIKDRKGRIRLVIKGPDSRLSWHAFVLLNPFNPPCVSFDCLMPKFGN